MILRGKEMKINSKISSAGAYRKKKNRRKDAKSLRRGEGLHEE
jgi:hypothetical protein